MVGTLLTGTAWASPASVSLWDSPQAGGLVSWGRTPGLGCWLRVSLLPPRGKGSNRVDFLVLTGPKPGRPTCLFCASQLCGYFSCSFHCVVQFPVSYSSRRCIFGVFMGGWAPCPPPPPSWPPFLTLVGFRMLNQPSTLQRGPCWVVLYCIFTRCCILFAEILLNFFLYLWRMLFCGFLVMFLSGLIIRLWSL